MKKSTLSFCFLITCLAVFSQTPRLSLYEEFTGENCPPCASANPPLNLLLASPTNTPKIVAIKWQVPIPSAPSNTWSLYQTNKVEIDWRWKTLASGGYGYTPAINSAPSSKIDGQEASVFGASSGHPANLNNNVISSAAAIPAAFSINMTRAWNQAYSAVNLTVNIQATQSFSATGNLIFRLVMIERHVHFVTAPGTNGEKDFEDVAVKSFPTLQNGTPMTAGTWSVGQTQTFTINCPLPSYIRDKSEIAFVGFIQDDGNQKVAQAGLANSEGLSNDAKAVSAFVPNLSCTNTIAPDVTIKNNGNNGITNFTITPYIDGIIKPIFSWSGNLAVGASTTMAIGSISVSGGSHTFSYNISAVSGTDNNLVNNSATTKFVTISNYQTNPIVEGFTSAFPPLNWSTFNATSGPSWVKSTSCGGFGLSSESTKMDFYTYAAGTINELILPPINLAGVITPTLTFDLAYATYANEADKLEVFVSDDCGDNWTNVYDKSGTNLNTAPATTSPFVPSAAQWRNESVNLFGYSNPSILLKFVATSAYGNNLYLDNVNLSQLNPVGVFSTPLSNINIEVFPNPTSGDVNLTVNSINNSNYRINLINSLGQVIFEKNFNFSIGINNIQIDTKQYPQGIYNVVLESNSLKTTKKITLIK
jgi:hypothetical protein